MRLTFAFAAAVALASTMPAFALQTVNLPQPPGDGTNNAQVPADPTQSPFTSTDSDGKTNGFGSFHFQMNSGSGWPGDPYRFYHPQQSTPDAYGGANAPGSEFSTGNTFYPH